MVSTSYWMAMANSVEIRLPFLDHRLIEYMARVPAKWKIRGLNEKYALKRCFAPMLPPRTTARAKHPYRAPIREALLMGAAREWSLGLLSTDALREVGLFDPGRVAALLKKLESTTRTSELDGMALMGVLSTQAVHREFVGNTPTFRSIPEFTIHEDRRAGQVRA